MNKIIIDGVEYYQPECKCVTGAGHICYLRPTPQVINAPIEQILKSLDGSHVSE